MAQKDKKAPAKRVTPAKSSGTKITLKQAAPEKEPRRVTQVKTAPTGPAEKRANIFARILGYFTGAWFELRQVQWPTRKSTWGLTIAVLLYSAFFVVLILLLDALFKVLFEQILK